MRLVHFLIYASKGDKSGKAPSPKDKYLAVFIAGCMVKSLTTVIFNFIIEVKDGELLIISSY